MTPSQRPSLFAHLRRLVERKARPTSTRRPGRHNCTLQLESLERRLLLSCEAPPPYDLTCRYVGTVQGSLNLGTYDNPWVDIPSLNAAIAAGDIEPGFTINFRRGDTFEGNLVFANVGGTDQQPITLQPYEGDEAGEPRPKIDALNGTGISVRNAAGMIIVGLEIYGSYDSEVYDNESNGNGIEFISLPEYTGPPPAPYERIELVDLNIHHFGGCGPGKPNPCAPGQPATGSGIYILGRQPEATVQDYVHFRDIKIYDNLSTEDETMEVHDNEVSGILLTDSNRSTETEHGPALEQVHIHHVHAHHQKPRVPGSSSECGAGQPPCLIGGEGIHLGGVRDGVIERNYVLDNGRADYNVVNAGLGSHNSQFLLIQYNEVGRTLSGGGVDGQGIDIDRWTTNSIVQYNFTHNNNGAGIMLGGEGTNTLMPGQNVVRYNVSQKDSRGSAWGGILVESAAVSDVDIYGNTVYMTPNGISQPAALTLYATETQCPGCAPPTLNVYNNLLVTTDASLPAVKVEQEYLDRSPMLAFKGNDYLSGEGFYVQWGATSYDSLDDPSDGFQTQLCGTENCETHNSVGVGANADPNLEDIGKAGSVTDIDDLHEELAPFYQLDDPPTEVATGGMNLFDPEAGFGLEWDPDGYWLTNWFEVWEPIQTPKDPFGVDLPLAGGWSIGVSQA